MSIAFECPSCRVRISLPNRYAGQKGRCKACGAKLIVPGAAPQPVEILEVIEPSSQPGGDNPWGDMYGEPPPRMADGGIGVASNPGKLRVHYLHYIRCFPRGIIIFLVLLLPFAVFLALFMRLAGVAAVLQSPLVLAGSIPFLVLYLSILYLYFGRVELHFEFGCVCPAVVLSVNPYRIAVYTDLSMGGPSRHVIKVLRQPLGRMTGGPPAVGQQLATVAMYWPRTSRGYYGNFDPRVANCATRDQAGIQRVLASISPQEWRALEVGLKQLGDRPRPGLYHVDPRREPVRVAGSGGPLWVLVGGLCLLGLFCCGGMLVGPAFLPGLVELAQRERPGRPGKPGQDVEPKPVEQVEDKPPPPKAVPQPPPDVPEPQGPPPKGWTALFRADDPALWNTASPGEAFALPVQKAHAMIRYVRLKRLDTGEYQVLPITRDQLTIQPQRLPAEGAWWSGTSFSDYGGRHLGIAVRPAFGGQEQIIDVMHQGFTSYSGSGFGHKRAIGDKQYYCWQGKEIPKTVFEIAVTADPLTEDERRFLAAPDDVAGPAPKGWIVLFRADDPNLWNTSSAGENFAVPTWRAPRDVRFLRLKRLDTGEALIVATSRAELAATPERFPAEGCFWNGGSTTDVAARLVGKGARLLGIAEGPPARLPLPADLLVVACSRDLRGYRGSGFAAQLSKKLKPVEQQFYTWKGQQIAKTAFEIAVTADALTDQENALLVK